MTRLRGTVKWFDTEKGWGFIRLEDGNEVFVHHSDIRGEGFRSLRDGADVELEVERADRGPRARRVDAVGEAGGSAVGVERESRAGRRHGGRSRSSGTKARENRATGRGSAPKDGLPTLDEQVRSRLSARFGFDT